MVLILLMAIPTAKSVLMLMMGIPNADLSWNGVNPVDGHSYCKSVMEWC
jgi:hypothetical protein